MKVAAIFLAAFLLSMSAKAEDLGVPPGSTAVRLFSTDLPKNPDRPRNYLFPPLASALLPGFDQWAELQVPAAMVYSGAAIAGLTLASASTFGIESKANDLDSRDDQVRGATLGVQLYSAAGSLSAYHSFRSAVKSRQPEGQFRFLQMEETTDQLLVAPFSFSHLKKPTTYIPLLGLSALALIGASQNGPAFKNNGYTDRDFAFGGAFSYLAGTHEEALFRGFLMPVLMESWRNEFWSNTATALVFSAAHISSDNPIPWPQFALGWYLGYVSQNNDWTLSESIFIHAWWDVIAFASIYLDESREKRAIYLPFATVPF